MALPISATSTTVTNSVLSGLNLLTPEYDSGLIQQARDEFRTFTAIMQMVGRDRAVNQDTYFHFEQPNALMTIGVNANVGAPGAGNPITWTIPANEHTADDTTFPVDGMIIEMPSAVSATPVNCSITTNKSVPGAHTVTATPRNPTDQIAAITTAQSFPVLSNAYAEGSDQPAPYFPWTTQYDYSLQILKIDTRFTGNAMTDATYVGGGMSIYPIADSAARKVFTKLSDAAFLTGPGNNGTLVAGNDNSQMLGMIPYARRNSTSIPYTAGNFGIPELIQVNDLMSSQTSGSDFLLFASNNMLTSLQQSVHNDFNAGGLVYGNMSQNQKDALINLGVKTIQVGFCTFTIVPLLALSDQMQMGAAVLPYKNYGIVAPAGFAAMQYSSDGQITNTLAVETTYKALSGLNRKFETWITGGGTGVPIKTDGVDVNRVHQRANIGSWWKSAKSWALFTA
jgi:hypothetical protein